MTDEEFNLWWYKDFTWTWSYMPENALNTIFVLYKLPLNIQDYLSSKGLSIGYSILYSAPKMHFNKYISGIASTLLQAPYNRNIACFSNPDRSNHWFLAPSKHMYNICDGNNASLQTIAKRIPYAVLHISKVTNICTREVDVLYTSCLFLYDTAKKGGSSIKQPIVADIQCVTYTV